MNKDLLRYEMAKKGISVARMEQELGISHKAFWAKCNGRSEFRQSEIAQIIKILELDDAGEIFFGQ